MRLIDADALIDKTDDRYSLHEIGRRERDDIVNAVEYAPTIEQPKRIKGRWIDKNGNIVSPFWERYECSVCGARSENSNFCPNCGADMRGGKDDQ